MEKELLEIVSSIEAEVWWFAAKVAVVLISALVIKQLIENLVAYWMFNTCSDLSVGVKVKINNIDGVISHVDKRFIRIKLVGGDNMLVPISRWRYQVWITKDFYRDCYEIPKRREGDINEKD